MSRIGRAPIPVPSGVEVNITGQHISIKGPKGSLEHTVAQPIAVALEEGRVDEASAAAASIVEAAEPHDELWDEAKALERGQAVD